MASIRFSAIVADARGSVGGNTFSRNANGAYVRTRTTPVNPNTTKQSAQRGLMSTVIAAWRALDEKGKFKYSTHISSNDYQNRVGESLKYSGYQLFVKRNLQLLSIGLPIVEEPPVDPVFPNATFDSLVLEAAPGGLAWQNSSLFFTATPGTANQFLVLDVSGFLSGGAVSTVQTYRRLNSYDATEGDFFDIGPALFDLVGAPVVGAKMFIRAKVVDGGSGMVKEIGIISSTVVQGV